MEVTVSLGQPGWQGRRAGERRSHAGAKAYPVLKLLSPCPRANSAFVGMAEHLHSLSHLRRTAAGPKWKTHLACHTLTLPKRVHGLSSGPRHEEKLLSSFHRLLSAGRLFGRDPEEF